MLIHADDFEITLTQAQKILALSSACDGKGALNSVSIFANSPVFEDVAQLAKPWVSRGTLRMALHLNLVEGKPCSNATDIPLLVGAHATFTHDFMSILLMSVSPKRDKLFEQLVAECRAQLQCYLKAFPEQQSTLHIDSHQHTHAIPLVFDALLEACKQCNCTITRLRIPTEVFQPYCESGYIQYITWANRAKNTLLTQLCRTIPQKIPNSCITSYFCGVLFSGGMDIMDDTLLSTLAREARKQDKELEVLFHPISVPIEKCLDPENTAFTKACASDSRNKEAACIQALNILTSKQKARLKDQTPSI